MSRAFISAYTPSNTDPAILEQIFVQRDKLLQQIVRKLEKSMLTAEKHHILLVGARGCGKTHLLTLANERLQRLAEINPELSHNMRVAWLSEDEVFTDLVDIAFAIADALQLNHPDEFKRDYRALAKGIANNNEAALAILNALDADLPSTRCILLLTENMDRTFNQLSDMGQKTWRGFLQEKQRIATLATAQQLVESLTSRDEPFYGFFNIEHLSPLTADQAFELIVKIAEVQDNKELLQYLINDNNARYRIRALHYLAGGNQRMYVLLSELLTKGGLDDLVIAFEALADDLTPYFQERLRSLPPQQAKIVQYLSSKNSAQNVKTIAEDIFIAETTCSKQLSELRLKQYVVSTKQGKQSFYELSEPLMRLCLDIKNQRGKPLRLITQFIRAWFHPDQLNQFADVQVNNRIQQYCAAALTAEPVFVQPLVQDLTYLIDHSLNNNNYELAMKYVEELENADKALAQQSKNNILFEKGVNASRHGEYDLSIKYFTEAIESPDLPFDKLVKAYYQLAVSYNLIGCDELAISYYNKLLDVPNLITQVRATALFNRGVTYRKIGSVELEMQDYNSIITLPEVPHFIFAGALNNRGTIYQNQRRFELALEDYHAVISVAGVPEDQLASALTNRALIYGMTGQSSLALLDYQIVIGMKNPPMDMLIASLTNAAVHYGEVGEFEWQIKTYNRLIDLPNLSVEHRAAALYNRATVFHQFGNIDKAINDYSMVVSLQDAPARELAGSLYNRGVIYAQEGQADSALRDFDAAIALKDAPRNILSRALYNRGAVYFVNKQYLLAQQDYLAFAEIADSYQEGNNLIWFNLAETMLITHSQADFQQALIRAFEQATPEVTGPSTPRILLNTLLELGSIQWKSYAASIAEIYKQYGQITELANGLVQSLAYLGFANLSHQQLDTWLAAWQSAAIGEEYFELPLRILDAAIESIKAQDPQPLLLLPLEIRQLVLPLLGYLELNSQN